MTEINWDEITDKTNMFTLEGQTIRGKCVSVYDGDTIKCVFPIPNTSDNRLYKWNCRLGRVDTPELRTKNQKEKEFGKKVRDNLRSQILNKIVELKCGEFDKYGRLLVNIKLDNEDMSELLISEGLAFKYDGGTRQNWDEYLQNKK